MNPGDVFEPGEVIRTHKQTCRYLGGGVYIIVRPAWAGEGWLVEERTGFGSHLHAKYASRAEADLIAEALAATRPLYLGEVA